MNEYILFEEKQRFRLIWLWIILLSIDAFLLYGMLRQVVNGQQFGSNPISNTGLLVEASFRYSSMKPIFGTAQDIDLSSDQKDRNNLNNGERLIFFFALL